MIRKNSGWKDFLVTLVAFVVIDMAYLSHSVSTIYRPGMGYIGKDKMETSDLVLGFATWVLLAVGCVAFVLPHAKTPTNALYGGALFGFIVYGVYNLTNKATLKQWDTKMMMTDMAWGTFLSGLVAWLIYHWQHNKHKRVTFRR